MHDLGGNAAREFVLIKAHALLQHQAVIDPAQTHRHIARQHLVFDQGLHTGKQRDSGDDREQSEQLAVLALPQLIGRHLRQPVDDLPKKAKEQSLERSDDGRQQHQSGKVAPHAMQRITDKAPKASRRYAPLHLALT